MKLGVLTLHYSMNEGSILQARGLTEAFSSLDPSISCEIIDMRYKCRTRAIQEDISRNPHLKFLTTYPDIPVSPQSFDSEKKAVRYINKHYDAVLLGSDEIWRVDYRKSFQNIIRSQNPGITVPFPNLYWPHPEIKIPEYAYAADIGSDTQKSIPILDKFRMKRRISKLKLLGIRSRAAKKFIGDLSSDLEKKCVLIPDPAFHLTLSDTAKQNVKKKLANHGIKQNVPTAAFMCYQLQAPAVRQAMRKLQSMGWQIVTSTPTKWSSVTLSQINLTPDEWLHSHGAYSIVVTDRMHSAISCLLNRTPFIGLSGSRGRFEYKIKELMHDFDMKEYYHKTFKETSDVLPDKILRRAGLPIRIPSVEKELDLRKKRLSEYTQEVFRDIQQMQRSRS